MMWNWIRSRLSVVLAVAAVTALAVVGLYLRSQIASRDARIAQLSTKLASSEQTVELSTGLYARKLQVIDELNVVIAGLKVVSEQDRVAIAALLKQVEEARQRVVVLDSLVVKWKKAYEGLLDSTQTEEPPVDGSGPSRKRVDFRGQLGPISVTGHTKTDPPESFVSILQTRPLRLLLALTRNRDGSFSTLVTSSEENVAVEVGVSGIDLGSLRPKWHQRIWAETGADLLGSGSARAGLSYRMDRWALGASCGWSTAGRSCGLTAGFRIFK